MPLNNKLFSHGKFRAGVALNIIVELIKLSVPKFYPVTDSDFTACFTLKLPSLVNPCPAE